MKKLFKNERGVAAIEFAIIFPLLLAIVLAVIEFGSYFVKDQLALNAISSISAELRNSPSSLQARENARKYGGTFMAFDENPNFFCAQAYPNTPDGRDEAVENLCTEGWNTDRPAGVDVDDTYLIAIVAETKKLEVAFSNFLPDIRRTEIIEVGGNALPDCNTGEIILKTNAGFKCRTVTLETKIVTQAKSTKNASNGKPGWGPDCPTGYRIAGCTLTCAGVEGEIDLSFRPNGCRVDGNSKCGGSTASGTKMTIYANCMRVVYN